MRTCFPCLLSLIVATSIHADEPAIKKALIIGIDGCRPDALLAAKIPHLRKLIDDGAFSDQAQTGDMTSSGPGWSSFLTGVWREKHGVRDNRFEGSHYDKFPDVLARVKKARPASQVASLVHWAPIQAKIIRNADHNTAHKSGAQVADAACKLLRDGQPDVLFVHFDDVDHAGHSHGFHPQGAKYLKAIDEVDEFVGKLLTAIRGRKGFAREDWLIVASTDHGGSAKSHGRNIPEHRTIFFLVAGPAAKKGKIEPAPAIVDVAPTVLRHLGIAIEPAWQLDGKAVGLRDK